MCSALALGHYCSEPFWSFEGQGREQVSVAAFLVELGLHRVGLSDFAFRALGGAATKAKLGHVGGQDFGTQRVQSGVSASG